MGEILISTVPKSKLVLEINKWITKQEQRRRMMPPTTPNPVLALKNVWLGGSWKQKRKWWKKDAFSLDDDGANSSNSSVGSRLSWNKTTTVGVRETFNALRDGDAVDFDDTSLNSLNDHINKHNAHSWLPVN